MSQISKVDKLINLLATEKSNIELFLSKVKPQGVIYTAGNGGSAAEAIHLTEELLGKYDKPRPAIRSICLCNDAATMSCISNDFGYQSVFARIAKAFITKNDTLVLFTTSGNSENIVEALLVGLETGCEIILLNGKTGGRCHDIICHFGYQNFVKELLINDNDSARIQEVHQFVMHELVEIIEKQQILSI